MAIDRKEGILSGVAMDISQGATHFYMDLRDHGHCPQKLVAALPRDPGNDEIRINARDLCVNGDENHHRPKAACTVLVEGVDETR